ncbi:MAG TPA: NUDIX domain-containing protein [Vitreimonas sp.]|nr:NUDIX domain-containing protein [Vitreimonas sp.]
MTDEELVYVVPRASVVGPDGWYGVRTADLAESLEVIGRAGEYRARSAMERDPAFKQVIPYLVLRDGDRWFLMRRTRGGRDERLHDRWSIGIGGHLNPGDGGLERGLHREWQEELEADFVPVFRAVGLLNDDTTDVGSVHLGVVYLADASGREVSIRETDKLSGEFVTSDVVAGGTDRLETWSRLVFEFLEGPPAD